MRYLVAVLLVVIITPLSGTAKADWCAIYRNGGTNCGFQTFQQCQASVSGIGGFCNNSGSASQPRDMARRRPASREGVRAATRDKKTKSTRQVVQQHARPQRPPSTRDMKVSPGDDEHVMPAEPD